MERRTNPWMVVLVRFSHTFSLTATALWSVNMQLFLVLYTYFYTFPSGHWVVTPVITPDSHAKGLGWRMVEALITPAFVTGTLFQILLNHRSRFFAGRYAAPSIYPPSLDDTDSWSSASRHRTTATIDWIQCIVPVVLLVPYLVGHYHTVPGIASKDVLEFGMANVVAWQALRLPAARVKSGEDEDEE